MEQAKKKNLDIRNRPQTPLKLQQLIQHPLQRIIRHISDRRSEFSHSAVHPPHFRRHGTLNTFPRPAGRFAVVSPILLFRCFCGLANDKGLVLVGVQVTGVAIGARRTGDLAEVLTEMLVSGFANIGPADVAVHRG